MKSSNATTRSTAGPGFAFEDQIGAYSALADAHGRGPSGSRRLNRQVDSKHRRKRFGGQLTTCSQPAISVSPRKRQLAVSCKSGHQVTGAGLPEDFVLAAWDQWSKASKGPMNRDRDSLMLATRGHHSAFEPLWADIKNWSGGDSKVALARIGETAKHRKLFASIRNPVKTRKSNVRDDELIKFTRRLEVLATDFDLANSDDQRKAVGRCRALINGGKLADGRKLWNALVGSTRTARLGHGTIDIASLVSTLPGNSISKTIPTMNCRGKRSKPRPRHTKATSK